MCWRAVNIRFAPDKRGLWSTLNRPPAGSARSGGVGSLAGGPGKDGAGQSRSVVWSRSSRGGGFMSPLQPVGEFARVAREYCAFIESFDAAEEPDSAEFLTGLSRLLPRLHLAAEAISDAEPTDDLLAGIDPDRRFALFSRLRQALGELDGYWTEFDVGRDLQERSGSLADDLADIYWELKAGLERLDREQPPLSILRCWGAGYRLHWGQHLVDAERHLYGLRARRLL
ncbi:MAG: DUF5063 domain-containing protein [Gammaproteobacteria bacterium]|nr:MAG: DUF5063 domain-containing protein [Gammaproteobacteria bacterium]